MPDFSLPECRNAMRTKSIWVLFFTAGMPECHYHNDYDGISCLVFLCRNAGMPERHEDKINLGPVFHCRNAGMPECHYHNDYDEISCLVFLCRNAGMPECHNDKINMSPVFHCRNAGIPECHYHNDYDGISCLFFSAGMPERHIEKI